MRPYYESAIGCLISGGGAIWTIHEATRNFAGFDKIMLPRGPLEVCAIGILVWLHAKWRLSIRPR